MGLDFIVVGVDGKGDAPGDSKVGFLPLPLRLPLMLLLLLLPPPVLFLLPKVIPPGLVIVLLNWNCSQEWTGN